ncbi:hypothetical protein ACUXZZ_45625 (plasmid) [Streptomyces graminifolii]|uniref:hypothetical protein n=1 Tax=Streptomyces graminifolii TaxID=1266771 RepID=UPI004057D90C
MPTIATLTAAEALETQARELTTTLSYGTPPIVVTDPNGWRWDMLDHVEELRESATNIRQRIENSRDHIRDYYGLRLHIGLGITYDGRPGAIAGFAGQYVVIQLDGDNDTMTCHTGSLEYPPGVRVGPGPDERFAHLVEVHP